MSVTSYVDDNVLALASICTTSHKKCKDQRTAISSVFDKLRDYHDTALHECSWQGVSCNQRNIIAQIWIGEKYQSLL